MLVTGVISKKIVHELHTSKLANYEHVRTFALLLRYKRVLLYMYEITYGIGKVIY